MARWAALGALFAIPFLALLVDRRLLFPYVAGRGFAFRMLVEVAVAGWVLLALRDARYGLRGSRTVVLFGLYVAWMAVADLFAVNPHKALWGNLERMDGWITLAHLFAFLVVASATLGAEGLWRRWWFAFVGASGLVCGYGLLQLAHLARVSHDSTRIDALFGNPEFLAGYLLFAIAATLWLASNAGARRTRWALFALTALQIAILLASGTRGAVLGLLAAIAFCALAWMVKAGKAAFLAGGALAGLVIAGAAFWPRHGSLVAENPVLSRFADIGVEALRVRFTLWRMGFEAFLSRPLLGWGQEGFGYVFNRFYDPSLTGQEPWFDRAHNLYLDILVAGGLPALLLFLAAFLSAAQDLWHAPFPRPGRIALLGGMVAYAVQALVVFDNLLTYLPLAALLALAHSTRSKAAAGIPPAPRRFGWAAAPVVVLSLATALWFVNIQTLRASGDVIRALAPPGGGPLRLAYLKRAADQPGFASGEIRERLAKVAILVVQSADAPEADKAPFIDYAIREAQRDLADAPHEVRLRLELATLYRIVGEGDKARGEIALALADAPRNPMVLQERGLAASPTTGRPAVSR